MEFTNVPDLKEILPKSLLQEKKVVSVNITDCTNPGENYGSNVFSLTITLQNEDTEEKIFAIAKQLPANPYMRKYMNSNFTFRNELGFYQKLLPTLEDLQKLDFFPKFIGGRLSLDPANKFPDDNAIILLEDLKQSGFEISDRVHGFDLDTTKLILTKMAQLHATSLALKLTKPQVFEETFGPYFEEFYLYAIDGIEDNMIKLLKNTAVKHIAEDELGVMYVERVKATFDTCTSNYLRPRNSPEFTQDTFATFVHRDLWVNNIMVKSHMNKIQDVKFLDMQLYEHASITKDVLIFMFTSVQDHIVTQNFDELIGFYYRKLAENLKELECDVEQLSFGVFENEMKNIATNVAFLDAIKVLTVVFMDEEKIDTAEELNNHYSGDYILVGDDYKKRVCTIARKYIQKGWFL